MTTRKHRWNAMDSCFVSNVQDVRAPRAPQEGGPSDTDQLGLFDIQDRLVAALNETKEERAERKKREREQTKQEKEAREKRKEFLLTDGTGTRAQKIFETTEWRSPSQRYALLMYHAAYSPEDSEERFVALARTGRNNRYHGMLRHLDRTKRVDPHEPVWHPDPEKQKDRIMTTCMELATEIGEVKGPGNSTRDYKKLLTAHDVAIDFYIRNNGKTKPKHERYIHG